MGSGSKKTFTREDKMASFSSDGRTPSVTRRQLLLAGAAGSLVLVSGVAPSFAADKPKVGLVMKSLANEFFKQMQAGAEKYAAENVDKFDFKAVGMKDERDFAAQVDAVENFVTQKYDIIVVAPADSKAMVTPLAKALKAGVKVINIDVELDAGAKKNAGVDLAFFGPDNRGGAKLAGDALAKELGAGGKVVILEGNPEADNAQQRKAGFMDSIAEGKLELLDSKTAHWETEEANTLMTNFLTKHNDIQGVMAAIRAPYCSTVASILPSLISGWTAGMLSKPTTLILPARPAASSALTTPSAMESLAAITP